MSATLLPKHVAAVLKQQKDHLKALEMFNKVKREDGFKHNLLTYKCIIQKLGFHGNFVAMENVLAEMRMDIDNSFLEGVYIGAMKSYGRKGKVQEAVDVFERMDFYNCEPSVLSYNAIMNILVESGYFKEAHKVFLRMKNAGIVPDVYTFTIRIKSFCRTKRPHAALRLLNNMVSRECQLNAVSYCTVVAGFYEEDYRVEAYELFNDMLRIGIFPDISTFNKLLHTLCKKGEVQESEKLLNKVLKKGMCPNLFTFNIFIQGLCRKGMLSGAMTTYNIMINAFSEKLDLHTAEKLFHEMGAEGCAPDTYTYRVMIDGFCITGNTDSGYKFLLEMIEKGFIPSLTTFGRVINCLCVQHRVHEAVDIIHLMVHNGIVPEVVNTISDSDKKVVAAPKIVVEDLLKRSCITYYAYELLGDVKEVISTTTKKSHPGLSIGWYWKEGLVVTLIMGVLRALIEAVEQVERLIETEEQSDGTQLVGLKEAYFAFRSLLNQLPRINLF
ncbi:hypothetical protein OIU76_012610 [Salix suchowensis]|nr:hypothetical protein OIU76_012610 [Salix suchowensis]